jgi:hypothetical protein
MAAPLRTGNKEKINGVASCEFPKEEEIQSCPFCRKGDGESSGTWRDFFLWTSCLKEPPPTQTHTWRATLTNLHAHLRRVRPHKQMADILLQHENVRPHVSLRTTEAINKFGRVDGIATPTLKS